MTGGPFQLAWVPALSRAEVNREESLRADAELLRSRWSDGRVVLVDVKGRSPVLEDATSRLAVRPAKEYGDEPPERAVFLGRSGEVDFWALLSTPEPEGEVVRAPGRFGVWTENVVADGVIWVGLREHGDYLDDAGAGLFTTAVALANWHKRARFCAKCGDATELLHFGWAARCTGCSREEYPRTDPAVICLVHDDAGVNGERVLLACGANWPEGAYSVLAGFVEAGESLEGCVVREIREEVGVRVRDVRYLGSQPWPFPRSIMLGFAARASADDPITPADGEIQAARWFTRAEVRETFARGSEEHEPGALRLPGNSSIARVMLESWVASQP